MWVRSNDGSNVITDSQKFFSVKKSLKMKAIF